MGFLKVFNTFFMHPISEMKLDVLDSCVDSINPKKFSNITAGEFLNERLIELGLIKKIMDLQDQLKQLFPDHQSRYHHR